MAEIHLLKHQEALINMVRFHPEIPYTFLIGGFSCGKSFTDVSFMLFLVEQYFKYPNGATFGLIGASIKLLTQTVLKDFTQYCTISNIPFKDNSQKGFIQVGNVRFVYLSGADPDDIYAHNFMGAICDELDELPPERILSLIKAIQERVRVPVPASTLMPARSPFVVFTTTAQGLGGTYQLIQYLKKVQLPHALIRARTADNFHNDPIMIANLTKLYTPEERDAFLEGKFVNLAAGRVYPAFNRSKHVYMPFAILPTDHIYVGADFNYGYDNTSCLIERAGHLYVISEHQFTFMGDAPGKLREKYPSNEIEFVPDASGKEVMQGLVKEFTDANVSVFWNSVNPGIGERVTATNRLLAQNRLHVFSNCERVALGLEIQDYDDMGKPRKGKGPDAVDHILDCLSYAIWRIIHQINGYDDILDAIRAVHHHNEITNPLTEAAA